MSALRPRRPKVAWRLDIAGALLGALLVPDEHIHAEGVPGGAPTGDAVDGTQLWQPQDE